MNRIKLIFMGLFIISSTATYAQEIASDSIKIESQKVLIIEKQKEVEFLEKFIAKLKNSEGDNSTLIKTNQDNLKVKQIELLESKAHMLDLIEKMSPVKDQIMDNLKPKELKRLNTIKDSVNVKIAEYSLNENSKRAFANKTLKYEATIWNTNFTIPVARFNFSKDNTNTKYGDVQLFNSIGAGFGLSFGTMTDFRDASGNLENSDFVNSFSIHGGFLFSAGSDDTNVFGPVLTIGVLDFQVGFGVELGTIKPEHHRSFMTLCYAIPLYKLTKGRYKFYKKGAIINEIDTGL